VRGRPVRTRASKNSSGRPATPVLLSASHSSVLPLRWVAQTRYEVVATWVKVTNPTGLMGNYSNGSSRSRTASLKPASAARVWKA
jgi:hypothetical protein